MCSTLQLKFNLMRQDKVFMGYVDDYLHRQWKRTRGKMSEYWKSNGGHENAEVARSKVMPGIRSVEDWTDMCDYWELESTKVCVIIYTIKT